MFAHPTNGAGAGKNDGKGEEGGDKDDDDSDDVLVRGRLRRHKPQAKDDSDDSDDSDDVRPAKRRRGRSAGAGDGGDSSEAGPVTPVWARQPSTPIRTPSRTTGSRSVRKSARFVRQRHMELLRRRRQGEKMTESDMASPSSSSGEELALYDKDPELVALSEFEDEEEDEVVEATTKKGKGKEKEGKGKKKGKEVLVGDYDSDENAYGGDSDDGNALLLDNEEEGEDMSDFIDDSHAGLIGEPDEDMLRREIPLQFTSQAHKPLKSHFKDAVEWLVQRRLDPDSGREQDEVYQVAWDRLDREVGGLAQSRFVSAIWTPTFLNTLQARPYMDSMDLRNSRLDIDTCHACGRSGHPATYRVVFSGAAYDLKTLEDVEEEEDDEEDSDDGKSRDMHGNVIAPVTQDWYLGATCNSNAETAHDLLHWRRALKDWVEERLTQDGLLAPARGQARERMKARKRRALVTRTVDEWEANRTISSLYGDFMRMLEGARTKSNKTHQRWQR